MKKYTHWIILGAAVTGMGIAMPSCPGQQEMKQQIDALQTANNDLTRKVQTLTQQVTALHSDMNNVKTLIPQMSGIVTTARNDITKLRADLDELQSRVPAKKGKKKK